MIGITPDTAKTIKMPPLKRSIDIDLLLPSTSIQPNERGYKSLRALNDSLLEQNERLFLCACAGLPLGFCIGLICGLLVTFAHS